MTSYAEEVKNELDSLYEQRENYINDFGIVRTSFSFFRVDDQPGLLTPWWETKDYDDSNMDFVAAGKELVLMVGWNLMMVGGGLVSLVVTPFLNQADYQSSSAARCSAAAIAVVSGVIDFTIDLVMSLVAMVTRSLASVALGIPLAFEALRADS